MKNFLAVLKDFSWGKARWLEERRLALEVQGFVFGVWCLVFVFRVGAWGAFEALEVRGSGFRI